MNRLLLGKELRSLAPYAMCLFALFAIGTVYTLATEMPDQQAFDPVRWMDKTRSGSLMILAFFGMLVGAGLLMQESEQRTLLFLDGLPVSRTHIFFIKVLAALIVIALAPLLDFGSDIFFGYLSRTSISGPFPWKFIGVEVLLQILAGLYLIALAMLISYTRAWFPLITGLVFLAYLWLRDRGLQWLAFFDTYTLLGPPYVDSRVLVSWRHVAAHLGAAAGFLGIAWLGFLSLGDRAQYAVDRLGRLRFFAAVGTGVRWLAPVVWIAALIKVASSSPDFNVISSDAPVGEKAFAHHETKHYEFLYRSAQSTAAKPLLGAADHIYDQVVGFLGAPPAPSRVVVDLASPVVSHAAGQTNWTKIRMPLTDGSPLSEQTLILGHETTHVFIEQLSNGRLADHFNEIRFLHEGLATYVELQLFGSDKDRAWNRREIAGAWSRGKVPLESLMNNEALSKVREPNLAYALGESFARALVESQGRDAPARLLRAFGRKNAPTGLHGQALWRDTMQAAGLSLDRVAAAYDANCAAALKEEKAFVGTLPRLAATVRVEKGNIVVQPIFLGLPPGAVVCLTEDDNPLGPQLTALRRRPDGTFTWPAQNQSSAVFRYLLGWRTPGTRLPVYEPWAETVPK